MSALDTDAAARLQRLFAQLALAAAALTFVVVVASAFMRHTQVGLACPDWPACYGRITADAEAAPSTAVRIVRLAHRIAATGVLALVIGLVLIAWTQKPAWRMEGTLALAALVVVAALAALGVATPGAKLPAVTLGNLLGGYALLALLAALVASGWSSNSARWPPLLRILALVALALVLVQAALGGSIGAQYALAACPTLGKCPGFPFDEFRWTDALDPFRPLSISDGRVVAPKNAAAVYVIHRTLGLVVPVFALLAANAVRVCDRRLAWTIAGLALLAPAAGAAAIATVPSLPLTVAHNAVAALLVAALAMAAARGTPSRP